MRNVLTSKLLDHILPVLLALAGVAGCILVATAISTAIMQSDDQATRWTSDKVVCGVDTRWPSGDTVLYLGQSDEPYVLSSEVAEGIEPKVGEYYDVTYYINGNAFRLWSNLGNFDYTVTDFQPLDPLVQGDFVFEQWHTCP